jgi:enoyl-CoA hydratase/carnithine racemase
MAFEFIDVRQDGGVATLTLNRPQVMNAVHSPMHAEMAQALDAFAADPDQWVMIITGAGERAFSAGNDLKWQASGGDMRSPPSGFAGLTSRFDLAKPLIAAVNGVAMGGGFEIALACDLIIAAEGAVFALPEPRVGLAALAGGLHRLPRAIGLKRAMGMILTARRVSAQEGLELGFVNEVTSAEALMPAARRWAEMIAQCSPLSIQASKAAVMRGLDEPSLAAAIAGQSRYPEVGALFRSQDFVEGPRAFAEKRAPEWTGR